VAEEQPALLLGDVDEVCPPIALGPAGTSSPSTASSMSPGAGPCQSRAVERHGANVELPGDAPHVDRPCASASARPTAAFTISSRDKAGWRRACSAGLGLFAGVPLSVKAARNHRGLSWPKLSVRTSYIVCYSTSYDNCLTSYGTAENAGLAIELWPGEVLWPDPSLAGLDLEVEPGTVLGVLGPMVQARPQPCGP